MVTGWHEGRLVCFDTESTGVDPHRDRIVTAACIEVGAGRKAVTRSHLINPGIPIPDEATAVHGITNDQASQGRPPVHAVRDVAEFLLSCTGSGIPVVGHNVVYDLTILWAELVRHDHHGLADLIRTITPVVDTKILEHHLDPYRPGEHKPGKTKRPPETCGSHKLIDCCRLWGVALSEEEAHGAEADALAAGRLAWWLAHDPHRFAKYAKGTDGRIEPGRWPLPELHRWQVEQFAAEAARYESYRRGEQRTQPKEGADPGFVAAREWPVQPPPAGWAPDQLPTPRETTTSSEQAVA